MRALLGTFLVSALVLAPVSAPLAMEFNLVGDTLVLSGPVVGDDLSRLRTHFATDQVKLVLLHNSPGGDLWNGLQLAQRIRDRGLPTAVSGKCESACGLIFLGGVQRSFSDGTSLARTMVGLHGAHHAQTRQAMPEMGARMAYLIRTLTEDKFPRELLDRTVYPKDPSDFIYAFHPLRFPVDGVPRGVMECLKQPDAKFRCTMIGGLDAIAIGVVTNPQVLSLGEDVKALLGRL
jgi:hypothetical protein